MRTHPHARLPSTHTQLPLVTNHQPTTNHPPTNNPTTAFFISDREATNLLITTRTVLEHLQHLQATPNWDKQQALEDSWGSPPAGGTANS